MLGDNLMEFKLEELFYQLMLKNKNKLKKVNNDLQNYNC